jgi:formylglycine-generating enzyme required for sulfatase activity
MDGELDFYAVLGVPKNAPGAEIRRAFRARAKELHPDSQLAADHEAGGEFSLLSEAYETLKDPARRKAYDGELSRRRQIAAHGGERPRHAFAKGLAAGLLAAVLAIGAKIYLDRAVFKLSGSKIQESLRVPASERPAVTEAVKSKLAHDEAAGVPAAAGANPADAAAQPAGAGILADPSPGEQLQQAPISAERPEAAQAGAPATETLGSPQRPTARPSAFASAVLALEGAMDSSGGSLVAYQLVSLVNSATAPDQLLEAASLARRPETLDLIKGRIAALKEGPGKQQAAEGSEAAGSQESASASKIRIKAGTAEIAVGPKEKETVLHLTPGNGLSESFSDCPDCPEMVVVPGGQTVMGSRPESGGFRPEEAPAHRILIKKPLAISKHWITAGNWRACVEAGACRPTISSFLAAGSEVPATRVSWFDAKAYADWLSRTAGRHYRLLSEAEWEYAAQAQAHHAMELPLKPETSASGANDFDVLRYGGRLRHAAAMKPNPWGLYALPGNALEWVEDCWHANYGQAPADASPWLAGGGGDCAYRVVRGGGQPGDSEERRTAARAREFADARAPTLGFRVAREVTPPAKPALDAARGKTARGD